MNSFNAELPVINLLDALNLEPAPDQRQRLLRFSLSEQDSVLLPLEQITEILQVNVVDILSIPELPDCILGICNWRGEMLWLIDFPQVTGHLSPFQQELRLTSLLVLVVQINQQFVGLSVTQVNDVELHDLQQLQPALPGLVSPGLLPLVWGLLPGCNDAVLNIKAIADYSLWKKRQATKA